MHVKLIFTTCLLFSLTVSGQVTIIGIVQDSLHLQSVQQASVTVLKKGNKVTTVLTDTAGKFRLNLPDREIYEVEITHVNYEILRRVINGAAATSYNFKLTPNSALLTGVSVSATKRLIEQTNDKIIYNVENDVIAKGENAFELLRKTPSVSIDGTDAIRLNGQTSFVGHA